MSQGLRFLSQKGRLYSDKDLDTLTKVDESCGLVPHLLDQ